MPSGRTTRPAVVFKPHARKRQLAAYNAQTALELMMRRDPLPPVFGSAADVIEIPSGTIDRSELVIKHESVGDLMRRTRNDEG
jgi:hypothetical protein